MTTPDIAIVYCQTCAAHVYVVHAEGETFTETSARADARAREEGYADTGDPGRLMCRRCQGVLAARRA